MNLKKYIGVIIIILTVIGIVNQRQVDVHNQEIVLQFTDANHLNSDDKVAIVILERELKKLGVEDFKVIENNSGKLKITYYSDADVSAVKRILLKNIRSELDDLEDHEKPFSLPFEKNDIAYNLEVYEIQNGNETDTGLNGVEVLELKPKSDRFFKPKTLPSTLGEYSEKENAIFKVAFNLHKNTLHALNNALKQIPEVRAGPRC
ncbi:hypothetical protein CLV33_107153 [Jejuia pallidilutea]|uniref:Uncharacterized protein n=1 Tax=Jejuia pallidilutea TaxID=504487 RepID=A0A362WZK0_9FLAO|nr:hypothetical protein [Jejuia pallidilutea]PQV47368.1 hypothetical protein CLV33_107153 [Jejuia pallidilutea]